MATSHSFEELGKRLELVADGTYKNVGTTLRKVALQVDQVAVLATPVDTGRARANWLATVGAPAGVEADFVAGPPVAEGGNKDANAAAATPRALEQAQSVIGQYRLEHGPIFLTNNVPYIGALDRGHSRQAPAGMTVFALQAGQAILDKERILPR